MSNYSVYLLTNKVNGKIYVGQSVDPKRRWYGHTAAARRGKLKGHLPAAIRKYGPESFQLEVIADNLCHDEANAVERGLIALWQTRNPERGYNVLQGGEGFTTDDMKARYADMTPEERKAHMAPAMAASLAACMSLSDEERSEKMSRVAAAFYANKTIDDKRRHLQPALAVLTPELRRQHLEERWSTTSHDERMRQTQGMRDGSKKWHENLSDEDRAARKTHQSAVQKARMSTLTLEQKQQQTAKCRAALAAKRAKLPLDNPAHPS